MPLYKFKNNDVIHSRIKTTPKVEFRIYEGEIYYKNVNNSLVNSHTPKGHINLHEINVNRTGDLVYPFLTKNSGLSSFKSISSTTYNKTSAGDQFNGTYPLTASISRVPYATNEFDEVRRKIDALKNTFDSYTRLSRHYAFSSSLGDVGGSGTGLGYGWDKSYQALNLISIPSLFYGSSIKKGSVNLKYYMTGTLIGHLRDENNNGELIQVGPTGSVGSGSVAGVVLYNEGFLSLTGSWDIGEGRHLNYNNDGTAVASTWLHFAQGANESGADRIPADDESPAGHQGVTSRASASYDIEFNGINYVPTITMFAHARKGENNSSENPTFIVSGSYSYLTSSNTMYIEDDQIPVKNIVSSSYTDYNEEFERHTYISKVGIYDEDQNLIAIAKLATPLKKTNKRDYTFKMRLDF